jgi:Xaa-Pro aminopeptidase
MVDTALRGNATEADAVAAGYKVAIERGVAPYDAAVASGPHSDHYAWGQLPSWSTRMLEVGDFFHVDTYGALGGYLYDVARCCVVGGTPTSQQLEILNAVTAAVTAGVNAIRPGVRACDIYAAVHTVLVDREMLGSARDDVIVSALDISFPAHGHSFGMMWERPWLTADEEEQLRSGMCFGIEAMAGRPATGSVKFEQSVIVTDGGAELLSTVPVEFW